MRVAVVDGYSSGRYLAQELASRGAECIHVRSRPRFHPYLSHTFQPADYVTDLGYGPDSGAVARKLTELGVTRIAPGTETGVMAADELAHRMGIPGNDYGLSEARHDKYAMTVALAAAGVAAPRSAVVGTPADAVAWYRRSGLDAVVVKPRASAASDQVWLCDDETRVAAACAAVLGSTTTFLEPNRYAVIQEQLAGPEYYTNTVTVDGTHVVVETWRYTKQRDPDGRPLFDFEEPADPDAAQTRQVEEYARRALTALGVRTGAAHSEIVVTARGPVLIDPGVRLGGGVLPWVTASFLGHSHAGLAAAGLVAPDEIRALAARPPARWNRPIRYVSLINRTPGVAASLDWAQRLTALPTVIALATGVRHGDRVPVTTDLLSSPGFAYLSAPDRHAVEADYRTIRAWEGRALYTEAPAA